MWFESVKKSLDQKVIISDDSKSTCNVNSMTDSRILLFPVTKLEYIGTQNKVLFYASSLNYAFRGVLVCQQKNDAILKSINPTLSLTRWNI